MMHTRRYFLQKSSLTSLGALVAPRLLTGHLPTAPLPLIIDADTANEVDDLYAIAIALLAPGLDIRGVTSAQWHTQKNVPNDSVGASQKLNEDILALMNKQDLPHPMGSNFPMVSPHRPQPSPAAEFIIEQAMAMPDDQKLHVAILGPATNLASAILMEPRIIPRVVADYLGFWHNPTTKTWSKREFNTNNDPNAVNTLIDTPNLEFHVMTASTSQHLVFDKVNVDRHLKGKGGLGDYLVDRWESYDRFWQPTDKEKAHWTMWDVALILALAYPELTTQARIQSPHDNRDRFIHAYTSIEVEAMKKIYWDLLDEFLSS